MPGLDAASHLLDLGNDFSDPAPSRAAASPPPAQRTRAMGDLPPREPAARGLTLGRPPTTAGFAPSLPADLVAPRDSALPDDLMAPRDSALPDDLVASREALPLLDDDLLPLPDAPGLDLGAPSSPSDRPAPDMAPGLDLFLGDLPSAAASPLAPLDFDGGQGDGAGFAGFGDPEDPLPPPPAASLMPDPGLPGADAGPGPGGAMDIGSMFESMLGGPPAAGAPAAALDDQMFAPPAESSAPGRTPGPPRPSFLSGPSQAGPAPELPAAAPLSNHFLPPTEEGAPGSNDSGFLLMLNGGQGEAPPAQAAVKPAVIIPGRAAGESAALPSGVARLAAPRRKAELSAEVTVPQNRRNVVLLAAGGGLVLAAAAFAVLVLPHLGSGPTVAQALGPLAADITRDHFPAYKQAVETLKGAAGEGKAPALRGAAAELRLLALLTRGADKTAERAAVSELEPVLEAAPTGADAPPEVVRARALLALARGRGADAETALGAQASTPVGQMIIGLRRWRERKPDLAIKQLKAAVAGEPSRVLAQYLLGRALEDGGKQAEARTAYAKTLAANPQHAGALVGQARLQPAKPGEQRKAAEALAVKIGGVGSPTEVAEAQVLLGEAQLALGRSPEAVAVLTKAVAAYPQGASGQRALVEALLADGHSADALARLRAADPAMLISLEGRIAMGAALVANGQVAEGTSQLEAAAAQSGQNPRVPYWLGIAAESRRPPDPTAAAAHYKRSLEFDPVFLPASLRMAALMQKQGKPEDAIRLIKEAEKAGAPAEALELAWGQALIEAKNPTEAELVFRRAVDHAPALPAARVGLATALEALGKADQAEAELAKAITELKGAAGLRERLSDLLYRRGKKEAALGQLDAELKTGNKSQPLRVRLAKLALELGQHQRAARELESVITEDPATPEALFTLGRVNEASGDLGAALRDYKRALAFESSPDLHLYYGRALARSGRDDEALGQLAGAGERASARLERARVMLRKGDVDKALEEVEAASRVEPDNAQAQFVRGLCLDLQGRAEDAATAWRAAVKADPKMAEAQYRLGRYEMDKGRQKVALEHFRMAGAKDPGEVIWRADLFFQLGFAESAAGSRGRGAEALKKYLEYAAHDAPARPEAERELTRLGKR
jgi:tetratricopeptide (TPR) repeat protein